MSLSVSKFSSRFLVVVALLAAVGCSSGPSDGYTGERGQVSGTVTLDGAPLTKGCQVIFISKTGSYTASGVVGDDGKYSLVYNGGNKLPAVEYQVQLTAPVVNETTPAAPVDPTKMAAQMNLSAGAPAAPAGPFPTKYASTNSSTLEFKVEPKDNVIDLKLTKE